MSRKRDMLFAVVLCAMFTLYVLSMIFWPKMPKDVKVLKDLYYITTASVMYMLSWIVFMLCNNEWKWIKGASCLGIGVFSVNLYVEIFLDPTDWSSWDFWLIIFVTINMFLSIRIIDKIKKSKK